MMDNKDIENLSISILNRAESKGLITAVERNTQSIKDAALEEAEEHREDDEIGSSDFHFIVQGFLQSINKPSIYSKVIRVKLLKDTGSAGGFCMAVGSIIELYDGGFRSPEVNANYYPNFGPYTMIAKIAKEIIIGANSQAAEMFEVVDVTNTINPPRKHEILDEAGGMVVCTINHKSLMELLKDNSVTRDRISETEDKFRVSNTLFQEDVVSHDIKAVA